MEPIPSSAVDSDTTASLEVRVAVIEERMRGEAQRLALQGLEYERRLTDLNHAHEKQVKDQNTYVGRELFEAFTKEERAWRETITATLADLQGRSSGRFAGRALLIQVLPLLFSGITLVVLLWKR